MPIHGSGRARDRAEGAPAQDSRPPGRDRDAPPPRTRRRRCSAPPPPRRCSRPSSSCHPSSRAPSSWPGPVVSRGKGRGSGRQGSATGETERRDAATVRLRTFFFFSLGSPSLPASSSSSSLAAFFFFEPPLALEAFFLGFSSSSSAPSSSASGLRAESGMSSSATGPGR